MTRTIATICGLTLYLLATPNSDAQDRLAISPGVGVSFATLRTNANDFIERVGSRVQFSKISVGPADRSVNQILIHAYELGVTAVCDAPTAGSELTISGIVITNPVFLVRDNGLHVGSQEKEVVRLMGSPSPVDLLISGYRVLQYPQRGIVFSIGGGVVVSITVLPPGSPKDYLQQRGIYGMGLSKSDLLLK